MLSMKEVNIILRYALWFKLKKTFIKMIQNCMILMYHKQYRVYVCLINYIYWTWLNLFKRESSILAELQCLHITLSILVSKIKLYCKTCFRHTLFMFLNADQHFTNYELQIKNMNILASGRLISRHNEKTHQCFPNFVVWA